MKKPGQFCCSAILILGAAACSRYSPPRPPGLPNNAVWVTGAGNSREGRFIDCSVDSARNVNRCRAFYQNGKLDCERDFRLQPGDRFAQRTELDYKAWSEGEGILLNGGRKLVPLMPCHVDD
jgi:hypothetical protein